MKKQKLGKASKPIAAHVRQMLHMLSDGVSEQIYVSDPQTHEILFANSKTQDEFGKDIVGKKCYAIFENRTTPCPNCANKRILGKNIGKTYVWDHQNGGTKRWYRGICKAIKWADGKHVRYGIEFDITSLKKTEDALRSSEQFFRSVVENSHNGVVIIDDNFRVVYVNEEALRMSGYRKSEVIGEDFRKFIHKQDRARLGKKHVDRQNGIGVSTKNEFRVMTKRGGIRNVEIKCAVVEDQNGKKRTVSQLRDITENKGMELERGRFEERLSALNIYGQSLNRAKRMDETYKLMLDAAEKTLGFEIADILMIVGKRLELVAHRGYSKSLILRLPLDGETGITVEAARSRKSIYVPDVRENKNYSPIFLVRNRKSRFKLTRVRRRGILSELAVPIRVGSKVLGIINVESKQLAAFDAEDIKLLEILASHAAIAISNLRRQAELKELTKRLACLMKNTSRIMNNRGMHRKLKIITKAIRNFGWQRIVISLRDKNLEGTDIVTLGLNKREQKLLMERKAPGNVWRERLGSEYERFRVNGFYYLSWSDPWVREHVHGLKPETPPEKATTYAGVPSSKPAEEMIDWNPQDMLYAPLRTQEGRIVGILSMDDPEDGRKPTIESLAPLELFLHQAAMAIENAELIKNLKDARKLLEAYTSSLEQKVEERTHQLKESQEQLLRAQRMAVIGELAGMVGHDLRNPLTSIGGAAYYLKRHLAGTPRRTMEMLDLIENNISLSNKIINDLLDYSREVKLDLTDNDPKTIVRLALSCIQIPKDIQLITMLEDHPRFRADSEKLRRVFLNMVKNAIDAMPGGGKLTLACTADGDQVIFRISDTGVGMSEETIRKVWTPLFTTKAKGMGFGLPICKRFVEAHEGSITVKSALNKGTTFIVALPINPKTEDGGDKIWIKLPESLSLTTTKT